MPVSRDELARWLREELEIEVAETPLVEGHSAPMDYLEAAFFEPGTDESRNLPRDLVVWAARGAGKTFLGALATALDLVFKPGVQVRILAGSMDQAQRMHAHLRRLFERPALAGLIDGKVTDKKLRLINRSACELLAQSQASVRGTRVQKIRCDELELFDPAVWEAAQLATRSATCGGVKVVGRIEAFSTMHVPGGLMSKVVGEATAGTRRLFKWGVVDALEKCGPEHECASCVLHMECRGRAKEKGHSRVGGHVSVADAVAMKGRVPLTVWQSEMLCDRPQRGDSVYPEFDPARHVVDTEPVVADGAVLVCGMDFGFRAPTAIVWAILEPSGVMTIVDERVRAGRVLSEHVAALVEKKPAWVAIDPAGRQREGQSGKSHAEVMREAGLAVRSRPSTIAAGVTLVRARLWPADGSATRLRVHRRCRHVIEALESYHYDARRPESTEPVKDGPDHVCDAVRYLVLAVDGGGGFVQSDYVKPL